MIEAKPTTYNGIRFRSRLEARWACMFDQLGWHAVRACIELDDAQRRTTTAA